MDKLESFACYKGWYKNTEIHTDTEIVQARAYASKKREQNNRYGYWLVKTVSHMPWSIITEYVECEIPE